MSILFDEIVFGPLRSRRFGISLGINLLPTTVKFCTFDCVYCECGWTQADSYRSSVMFKTGEIMSALEDRCNDLIRNGVRPENLTFAGNGEPTLHPDFPAIIEGTIHVRDRYFPRALITVLSNASQLHKPLIREALLKVDNNVLKLDCGTERMFRLINRPRGSITLGKIVGHLQAFNGKLIIQALFIRGEYQGQAVDNTTEEEVTAWIGLLRLIRPQSVMIYSIDRRPPVSSILKVPAAELHAIATRVEEAGFRAEVYP